MKLKKLSALLLALCMVFALAACNNNEEVTPSPSPVTSDEPSPSPTTNQVMSPRERRSAWACCPVPRASARPSL